MKSYYLILVVLCLACADTATNELWQPEPDSPDETYIQDRNLLDKLQRDVFAYAWEYADTHSGMIRERYPDDPTITVGGSGFGMATLVVGVQRGYITRTQAIERLLKVTNFLLNKAETFHGAFPHWLDGFSGKAKPFSEIDDGADLVETAFLIQGLFIVREYFDGLGENETIIRQRINAIWERVEWSHFTNGNNHLLWHWSPNYGFKLNHRIAGFNECMIVYILALASPTYGISPTVYKGWTDSENYIRRTAYGYTLEAAQPQGGPLFFTHYSFIGLDPSRMADEYVQRGYFVRNATHAMINRAYCMFEAPTANRYAFNFWGLTACYIKDGYAACAPDNDYATIAPTAALASMPYTPAYSMPVLWNLYNNYQKQMWGRFGPADAMSLRDNWYATQRYLAIDQLPIACMIENYRSGLLWNTFMKAPEIGYALSLAGIAPPQFDTDGFHTCVSDVQCKGVEYITSVLDLLRHPDTGQYELPFYTRSACIVLFRFYNERDEEVTHSSMETKEGMNQFNFRIRPELPKGTYTVILDTEGREVDRLRINLI